MNVDTDMNINTNMRVTEIHFTKMHGIGNDYIYINCTNGEPSDPPALARAMSPRRFSVGSDGLILICPSDIADAKMRMFNADGSEGKMCGNGIRCVGKFIYDKGIRRKRSLDIETKSGIKHLELSIGKDGLVDSVRVDMGKYSILPADIPVMSDKPLISSPIEVDGQQYRVTAVSMGNPHAVIFVNDTENLPLSQIGPLFEHHHIFPEQTNTEFVRVIDEKTLLMRVWERGSGETLACGTGACAAVAASIECGICHTGEEITVKLLGGDLKITCLDDNTVYMTGTATTVYEGVYYYEYQA